MAAQLSTIDLGQRPDRWRSGRINRPAAPTAIDRTT
jgi:hypothetical protein